MGAKLRSVGLSVCRLVWWIYHDKKNDKLHFHSSSGELVLTETLLPLTSSGAGRLVALTSLNESVRAMTLSAGRQAGQRTGDKQANKSLQSEERKIDR